MSVIGVNYHLILLGLGRTLLTCWGSVFELFLLITDWLVDEPSTASMFLN